MGEPAAQKMPKAREVRGVDPRRAVQRDAANRGILRRDGAAGIPAAPLRRVRLPG